MIIIKSQDGDILTVNKVSKSGAEIVGDLKHYKISDGIGGTIPSQEYEFLGEYKSEEDAQRVMDQIEEHIRTNYLNEQYHIMISMDKDTAENAKGFGDFNYKNAIFTMPER